MNMKRNVFLFAGMCLLAPVFQTAAQPPRLTPAPGPGAPRAVTNDYSKFFKNDAERNGYAIGMNLGRTMPENLKRSELEFDPDAMMQGFVAGVKGETNKLNEMQLREIIGMLTRESRARIAEKQKLAQEKSKQDSEKNLKAGAAFLAAKKTEAGVIPLPSGLMYRVIKEGSGESPKPNDTVSVNYKGTLIDGTEFDSSEKTGKPATFRVTGVIKGWTEALELMKPGAKWILYIPANLAYGERGQGKIPSGSTLVFEVELVSVQPAPTASAAPVSSAPLTSDIIKVPSAEELKKGAKIETIKPEDIEKEREKEAAAAAAKTNAVAKTNN